MPGTGRTCLISRGDVRNGFAAWKSEREKAPAARQGTRLPCADRGRSHGPERRPSEGQAQERVRFRRAARQTLRNRIRCRSSFLKVAAPVAFRHHGKEQPGEYPSVMLHENKGSPLRRGRQACRKTFLPSLPESRKLRPQAAKGNRRETLIPRALRTGGLADITVWCPVEGFFRASFFPICCLYDG